MPGKATVEAPWISRNWFLLLVKRNEFCCERGQRKYLISSRAVFMAPVLPTTVTPDLLHVLYDSSLKGSQASFTSADSSRILPVLPFCFWAASVGPPAAPHWWLWTWTWIMVAMVGLITCCMAGLAACLNRFNCIKKAWNVSGYHWVEYC